MKFIFVFLLMTVLVVGETEAKVPKWVKKVLKAVCKFIAENLRRKRELGFAEESSDVKELVDLIGEREANDVMDDIDQISEDPVALENLRRSLRQVESSC